MATSAGHIRHISHQVFIYSPRDSERDCVNQKTVSPGSLHGNQSVRQRFFLSLLLILRPGEINLSIREKDNPFPVSLLHCGCIAGIFCSPDLIIPLFSVRPGSILWICCTAAAFFTRPGCRNLHIRQHLHSTDHRLSDIRIPFRISKMIQRFCDFSSSSGGIQFRKRSQFSKGIRKWNQADSGSRNRSNSIDAPPGSLQAQIVRIGLLHGTGLVYHQSQVYSSFIAWPAAFRQPLSGRILHTGRRLLHAV